MKKIITAIAIAAFGATAYAQEAAVTQPAPEKDFVIGAKFDFESCYVTGGKRIVNENTQTTISFKYFVPQSSDIGITPYAELFWMSPTDNERKGHSLSDEGSFKIGSEITVGEDSGIDFGYKFTGWSDRESSAGMNRADLNRDNSIYLGVSHVFTLSEDIEEANFTGFAYVYYDFNCEQITYEIGVKKSVSFDELTFSAAATYGYVDANKANGDQRRTGTIDGDNDYGYIAFSVDATYQINSGTDIGIGGRYAYNNDGDDEPGFNGDNKDSTFWWGVWINFRY